MNSLTELIGAGRCFKGAGFDEPMRIHQPAALYYGCLHWITEKGLPEGVVAQHGYYREIADCSQVQLACEIAAQKGPRA